MGFRKLRDCTIYVAETAVLISFAFTVKLICVFVFAHTECWFSHDAAQLCFLCILTTGISNFRLIVKINFKHEMSLIMRKPDFCICENKDADREADQRLCFRYMDSTIPLLSKSEIFSLYPSSVAVQPGLCRTWSETPKTGFLTRRLKLY